MGCFCLRSWSPVGPGRRWLLFTLRPRGPVLGGGIQRELKIPRAPGARASTAHSLEPDPAPTASPSVGYVPSAASLLLLQRPFLQPGGVVGEQGFRAVPSCTAAVLEKGRTCMWESRAQSDSPLENPYCLVQSAAPAETWQLSPAMATSV